VKNPSDITDYTGFEADLSEFRWDDSCSPIAGAVDRGRGHAVDPTGVGSGNRE